MSDLRTAWQIDRSAARERAEADRHEQERLVRVERATADPVYFCTYYLGHYFRTPPAPWQLDTLTGLEDMTPEAYAVPRGHGKSTWIGFGLVLWSLLTRRKRFALYIGSTQDNARSRIDETRIEIENNDRLVEDFGVERDGAKSLLGDTAKSDDIRLANGTRFIARGAGQSLRGVRDRDRRPDLCIVDDVDRDEQARSPERTQRLINWLRRVVFPLAGSEGMKLYVIGNVIGRKTLMTWCLGFEQFRSHIFRAIQDDGTPLMPALWPIERLLSERDKIGTDAFETEYQNNPPDEASQPFRDAWLTRRWTADQLAAADPAIWVALDPSKAKTQASDYQAIVAIQRDWKSGAIYLRKCDVDRRPPIQLIERLITFCEALGLDRVGAVGIEAVQFQEFFADIFDQVCARRGVTLRVVKMQQHLNKFDRITRLVPHVEGGRFYFPPDAEWDEHIRLLHDQIAGFPSVKYDDGPDALEMSVSLSNDSRRGGNFAVAPVTAFDRFGSGDGWDFRRDPWPDGYSHQGDDSCR